MKIVINTCYGGFSLSDEAIERLNLDSPYAEVERTDEALIALIEEIGSYRVSGRCAKLQIVNLPDDTTDWEISEYDGAEEVIYVVDGKLEHA